jgi:glycosyltransferase involved in cell wall biosynthesis
VLHVLDTDNWAGTESHVLALAAAQAEGGFVVPTIACPMGSPLALRTKSRNLLNIDLVCGAGISNASRLLRIRDRYDVLHAHNGRCLAASTAATLASSTAVVATQHFIEPASATRHGFVGCLSRYVHRTIGRRVDAWISVSEAAKHAMTLRGDAMPSRITVVPNGVADTPALDRTTARKHLEIDEHCVMILCVCRLETEKDIATLLAATCDFDDGVDLFIAGDGSQRADLERQASISGTSVRFMGQRDDIPDLMAASDIVVLPAPAEPFGLVLVEAMAAARPTVACAAGGPLEIIADGVTGFLVIPRNPSALATGINRLAQDASLRESMGAAARRRYMDHFSATQMALATTNVYHQALRWRKGCGE